MKPQVFRDRNSPPTGERWITVMIAQDQLLVVRASSWHDAIAAALKRQPVITGRSGLEEALLHYLPVAASTAQAKQGGG